MYILPRPQWVAWLHEASALFFGMRQVNSVTIIMLNAEIFLRAPPFHTAMRSCCRKSFFFIIDGGTTGGFRGGRKGPPP